MYAFLIRVKLQSQSMVQNLDPKLALKKKLEHRAQQNHEHHWLKVARPARAAGPKYKYLYVHIYNCVCRQTPYSFLHSFVHSQYTSLQVYCSDSRGCMHACICFAARPKHASSSPRPHTPSKASFYPSGLFQRGLSKAMGCSAS